jgi:hypothetical protein
MKLANLHTRSPVEMALKSNIMLKSMLQPLGKRDYYWKDFDKQTKAPPPPTTSGPTGGHYDAILAADPRKQKFFGGSFGQ